MVVDNSSQAKKAVNYAVDKSSGEDEDFDEEAFNPTTKTKSQGRATKRRKTSVESDDDDIFDEGAALVEAFLEEGWLSMNRNSRFRYANTSISR